MPMKVDAEPDNKAKHTYIDAVFSILKTLGFYPSSPSISRLSKAAYGCVPKSEYAINLMIVHEECN